MLVWKKVYLFLWSFNSTLSLCSLVFCSCLWSSEGDAGSIFGFSVSFFGSFRLMVERGVLAVFGFLFRFGLLLNLQ